MSATEGQATSIGRQNVRRRVRRKRQAPLSEQMRTAALGSGISLAFLDILFSSVGIFMTLLALQSLAREPLRPAAPDLWLGVTEHGEIIGLKSGSITRIGQLRGSAIEPVGAMLKLVATAEGDLRGRFARVEIIFSPAAIRHKKELEGHLATINGVGEGKVLFELAWRPASDAEGARGALAKVAETLSQKDDRNAARPAGR